MRLVWGTVVGMRSSTPSVERLLVTLDGKSDAEPATAYPELSGPCSAGERVLCNTTAVELGLGTGGEHFIVARAGKGVMVDDASGGHIMKLRYTPLQRDVLAVEEPGSPHHEAMRGVRSLGGMPVVCCGLHSQVPIVAASIKGAEPAARVVYVMTDEAALPMALSRLVSDMRDAGLVDGTVTSGQAFGGGLEAVNLYSALLAARHVMKADFAIVAIGPGMPGTATQFGHSGVAQGQAINAAASLEGRAIAALRLSFADPRPRHVPVSHQTLTALSSVALAPAVVAVPALGHSEAERVDAALEAGGVWRLHQRYDAPPAALPDMRGVEVRTMGRSVEEDPAFFFAAAAAGAAAASC